MYKRFTKNIGIKLICLLAATVLWAYVATSQNSIAKFPGDIKIKAFNSQQNLIAVYDTDSVQIKVMTESSNWKKLSADTFSAYIDLSRYGAGTYEVPVNVVSSIPGVQIVEKNPDKILVSLEPVARKEVPISKKIEGRPAEGMAVGNVMFNPEKAWIEGAKSIIENTSEVIAKIALNGEGEDFQRNITLSLSDLHYSDKEVTIKPSETNANVKIVKGAEIKTVGIKANVIGNPKNNYFVSGVTTTPNIIDISGPVSLLKETTYLETAPIDITNSSANSVSEIQLQLPSGISIHGGTSPKVQVKIEIQLNEISREISVSNYRLVNPSSIAVKKYVPAEVRLKCSGPAGIINNLRAGDITVTLDLSRAASNSNTGEISFDLSYQDIGAPSGILIELLTKTITLQTR